MPNPIAKAWKHFPLRTEHSWLNILLPAVPLAIYLHASAADPAWTFFAAAVAIIPLAGVLGEATEALSVYSGPTLGGLLNATMGNATELIIAFFALRAGHAEVVKASLSGSIFGNLLLVLGLSILAGGWNRETLRFSRTAAATNTTMLFIAVVALVLPAVFDLFIREDAQIHQTRLQDLSLWVSGVLIAVYAISFLFVLKTHKRMFSSDGEEEAKPHVSMKSAIIALVTSTIAIGYMSEMLVGEID